MKSWTVFLVLGMVIGLMLGATGCEDNTVNPKPPDDSRQYGPPFGMITFLDEAKVLGTVDPDNDTLGLRFVAGTGSGHQISDPGFSSVWIHEADSSEVKFMMYDDTPNFRDLFFLNENQDRVFVSDSVAHRAFSVSPAGTRAAYVKDRYDGSQLLILEKISGSPEHIEVLTVEPPFRILGAPQLDFVGVETIVFVINVLNEDEPGLSYYERVNSSGGPQALSRQTGRVAAIKMNDETGIDKIAYIPAPNGAELAEQVVIARIDAGQPVVDHIADFADFGAVGATNLSWARDGQRIAMFSGVFTPEPKLIVATDGGSDLVDKEIPLDKKIVLPDPDSEDLWHAFPNWGPRNDDGHYDRVVILVYNSDTGENEVAVVNIETDEMEIVVTGIPPETVFQPTWRVF